MSAITSWDASVPSSTSTASLLDDAMREFASAFATAIGSALSWPGSGGATALVGPKPGTLRFAVSGSNRTGGLPSGTLSVDTLRYALRHVGSANTGYVAHPNMLEHRTAPTDDAYWLVQEGSYLVVALDAGSEAVTFPIAYSAPPASIELVCSAATLLSGISTLGASGFTSIHSALAAGTYSGTVTWRSEGTVSL